VFIHNPLALRLGPLAQTTLHIPAWRTAEFSFGFFMGIAIALGVLRLQRGGLAAPIEDTDRSWLDAFAVFAMLIALPWANFRRHFARVLAGSDRTDALDFLYLSAEVWYALLMVALSAPLLFALHRYRKGDRTLVPQTAIGKAAQLALIVIWMNLAAQLLDGYMSRASLLGNLTIWLPAVITTMFIIGFAVRRGGEATDEGAPPDDPCWRIGWKYAALCLCVPLLVLGVAWGSVSIQDGPLEGRGRKRFGEDAYWRQTARLQGAWQALYLTPGLVSDEQSADNLPLTQIEFDAYRNATHTTADGERIERHRWFLKNQYFWLQWYGKDGDHPDRAETPLQFREGRLFISWPPETKSGTYLVLERVNGD
jgi:hypothetical protein